MANLRVQATKPFTLKVSSNLESIACNAVVELDSTLANQLISDGLAKEFTLITPTGEKNITANGDYDVTQYASVKVAVE